MKYPYMRDSDGDGTGDLAGITSRLDYLACAISCLWNIQIWSFKYQQRILFQILLMLKQQVRLGVETFWLSPIYRSPMADFGYDISSYVDIDPIFGTLQDFDQLSAAAKVNHNTKVSFLKIMSCFIRFVQKQIHSGEGSQDCDGFCSKSLQQWAWLVPKVTKKYELKVELLRWILKVKSQKSNNFFYQIWSPRGSIHGLLYLEGCQQF